MKKIIEVLKAKNILCGYLYFYIHFITEVACFYFLSKVSNSNFVWLVPLIYDGMAFVPQALIGYMNDKRPKIIFSIIGTILIILSFIIYFGTNLNIYLSLICLCIGNACIHVNGAEITLKSSEGKLAHSAIFVAGGSFGVITGKLLSNSVISFWGIILFLLTMIPFILLAETYNSDKINCNKFNYTNNKISPMIIIILTVLVVTVRGYLGYGIPTSWNKTTIQTIILFCIMGLGKALGGILSDAFGIRKIAIFSTIIAVPFLCLGDNFMIISLIGVMFFSMTMSITLAILVSVLKATPGLGFGLTTIGLFLGTIPIFFIKITNQVLNLGIIIFMSIICTVVLSAVLKKEEEKNELDLQ